MMNRIYILNGHTELTRKEFEDFLVDFIEENELYALRNLTGVTVRRSVEHHPLRLAREIGFDVVTFLA